MLWYCIMVFKFSVAVDWSHFVCCHKIGHLNLVKCSIFLLFNMLGVAGGKLWIFIAIWNLIGLSNTIRWQRKYKMQCSLCDRSRRSNHHSNFSILNYNSLANKNSFFSVSFMAISIWCSKYFSTNLLRVCAIEWILAMISPIDDFSNRRLKSFEFIARTLDVALHRKSLCVCGALVSAIQDVVNDDDI